MSNQDMPHTSIRRLTAIALAALSALALPVAAEVSEVRVVKQRYSDFMYEAGYVKTRANSWKDLYFPDIHDQPGS